MTTTPCGLPDGCHSRVKILSPPTPSKLPSVMRLNVAIQSDSTRHAPSGRPLQRHSSPLPDGALDAKVGPDRAGALAHDLDPHAPALAEPRRIEPAPVVADHQRRRRVGEDQPGARLR